MPAAYEVSAVLKLVDQASPALRRIIDLTSDVTAAFERLKTITKSTFSVSGINEFSRELSRLDPAIIGVTDAMERAAVTVDAGFDTMIAGAARLRTELGLLRDEMATLRMPGAAGGGGRHDGGRLHARAHAGPVSGYFGVGGGEAAGLGLGFGMYEGVKYAATEELSYTYAQLAAGVDPSSPAGKAYAARLRKVAEQSALGTVYSRADVAKMMPGISGMADVPLEQSLGFMPAAIRFAETLRQAGAAAGDNFPADKSAAAAIRMSHLLGITDPEAMKPILDKILPALLTAHSSPEQFTRVAAYMLGGAAGVGMGQSDAIDMAALASILVPGTRAGTSINRMFTNIAAVGPGAHLNKHGRALRALMENEIGILNPRTHRLYADATGDTLMPFIHNLQKFYREHPDKAYGAFTSAFDINGARLAYEMARNPKTDTMAEELRNREKAVAGMGGVAGVQNLQNDTFSNTALRAWANVKTIFTDLAEGTVPGLKFTLKGLNSAMEGARGVLDANPNAATALGYGAGAAGLWGAWRLGRGALGWLGRGAAGTAAGAAAGGGAGIFGLISALLGGAGVAAAYGYAGWEFSNRWKAGGDQRFHDPAMPFGQGTDAPALVGAVQQSGDKSASATQTAADKIVAAILALPGAIVSGINTRLNQEMGKPTGDAAGHDIFHLPLEPAVPF